MQHDNSLSMSVQSQSIVSDTDGNVQTDVTAIVQAPNYSKGQQEICQTLGRINFKYMH